MKKFQNREYGYFYSHEFFFTTFVKPLVKKGIILDAGCGDGWLLSKLKKMHALLYRPQIYYVLYSFLDI